MSRILVSTLVLLSVCLGSRLAAAHAKTDVVTLYNGDTVTGEILKLYGGILESFGQLFGRNFKLYVYPSFRRMSREVYGLDDIEIPDKLRPLLEYMFANNKIEKMRDVKTEHLHIVSDTVLQMIRTNENGWEEMVPKRVAETVKKFCLFDYPLDPKTGKPRIGGKRKNLAQKTD